MYFSAVLPSASFKLHETNINVLLKFIIQRNILPSGWIKVNEYMKEDIIGCTIEERKFTTAVHDCYVRHDQVFPADDEIDETVQPDVKVLSFDIECFCINFNSKMPDPINPENEVYSIGCCLANITAQASEYKTYILSLENPPKIDGAKMIRF